MHESTTKLSDLSSQELYRTLMHNQQNPNDFESYVFLEFSNLDTALDFEVDFFTYRMKKDPYSCIIPNLLETKERNVLLAYPESYQEILEEFLQKI